MSALLTATVPAVAAPTFASSGLSATVSTTTVNATAVLSASSPVLADYAGICARDAAGRNVDFPLQRSVSLSPSGQRVSGVRTMTPGTYTFWSCARVGSRWYDIGAKATFTVPDGTVAAGPTPTPTPAPAPTTSPAPAPTTSTTAAAPAANRQSMSGVAIPSWVLSGTDAEMAKRLDLIAATGVGWVRIDVAASELEYKQGSTNWTAVDRIVSAADAREFKILGLLNTMPAWARPSGTAWNHGPTTSAQRAAYADFSKRAAARYRGTVDAWELWNEPNLDQFWSPTPKVSDYGLLVKEAYPAVKSADSTVPIIAGGTGWSGGGADIATTTWYSQLYAGGFKQYFDATNVHPYQDIGWSRGGQIFTGGEMGAASSVRQTMNSYGDSAKAIWGTEVGFPTNGGGNVTEAEQAAWIAPTYDGWLNQSTTRGKTGPLFYYTLRDFDASREGSFGLMRSDGTAKPAYTALRSWVD